MSETFLKFRFFYDLGFTEDSIEWLLSEREIVGMKNVKFSYLKIQNIIQPSIVLLLGVGTECFDIELPWKTNQAVKQILAAANKYSIVQVSQLKKS